jgi:hypothetical protein
VELDHAPNAGLLSVEQQRQRQQAFGALAAIVPVAVGSKVQAGLLGPGVYHGNTFAFPTRIDGIGWPRIDGQVTFQGAGHVCRGLVFEAAVNLSATANVEFLDCVFLAAVTVLAGGVICCDGGRFDGTSAILNAGLPAAAFRTGCVKTSTVADTNLTISGGQ